MDNLLIMTNFDIVAGLYNTTLSLFFFLLAFFMFLIAYKGYKADNKYGSSSTTSCGIIFLIFGYYNNIFWFLPFPFSGYMIWWIGIILAIFTVFGLIIRNVSKKIDSEKENNLEAAKDSKLRRFVNMMREENPYKETISIKMEGVRKSFHLAGLLFLLSYFGFFFIPPVTQIVNDTVIWFINLPEVKPSYNLLWGLIEDYPYTLLDPQAVIDLTMFALIATLVLTIISDLIRVLWGPQYSIFNYVTREVLRKKELNAMGPQIYLITGVIVSYLIYVMGLIDILAVVAGVLIACFSDALAALIGRKWGKHKVTCIGGDVKSWEGFIAGAGSAFLIGLIVVGPIYAMIGAIIFFLLDYFPLRIADNILNPIAISVIIGIVYILTGIPIGWGLI